MSSTLSQLNIIYLGGTFASIGHPLAPMDAVCLSDLLTQTLHHETMGQLVSPQIKLNLATPLGVCDSSQLNSRTFLQVERSLQAHSNAPCLVITGTDTLSFFSGYIALSHCHFNCCLIASMDTLVDPISTKLNRQSYAFKSLKVALSELINSQGLSCVVDGESLHPLTLSKLHSLAPKAFADSWGFSPEVSARTKIPHQVVFDQRPEALDIYSATPDIAVCFATPSHDRLVNELVQLSQTPPDALLLVGYGAGNFIHNQRVEQLLKRISLKSMLMITTQVNFGGCSPDYAAGSWLSEVAISSARLGYPASYAALLYACTRSSVLSERKKTLNSLLSDIDSCDA